MTPTSTTTHRVHHGDADGWIEAVAAEMAQTLNHDINEVGAPASCCPAAPRRAGHHRRWPSWTCTGTGWK